MDLSTTPYNDTPSSASSNSSIPPFTPFAPFGTPLQGGTTTILGMKKNPTISTSNLKTPSSQESQSPEALSPTDSTCSSTTTASEFNDDDL
jgi:pyocin large subunit-like protein